MNHEELKDAISAYCLGALDEAEKTALEAHLNSGCAECELILKDMQNVVGQLGYAAPAQKPPLHVKDAVLAKIEPEKTSAALTQLKNKVEGSLVEGLQRAKQKWMRLSWGLAFASAVIVFVFGLYSQHLQNRIAHLEKNLELGEQINIQLRTELTKQKRIFRVMQSEEIRFVRMQVQNADLDADGKVYWTPANREAVVALNLPLIPSDKDYQFWMLRGNEAIDAGVILLDAEGSAVFTITIIPDTENLTAFAVSLEPKGGQPQPTGAIYLLGVTQG